MKFRRRKTADDRLWVVHHASLGKPIAVFSTYKKAWKAYPQDTVRITGYEVDPSLILDLDVP
jgi:hypothetical protein